MTDISIFIAFAAGVFSFFSPCILPLIPSYIAFITGLTIKDLEDNFETSNARKVSIINSILFILGFSFVFILLGITAGIFGQLLLPYKDFIRTAGGIIIIIFGLNIAGVFKSGALNRSFKFNMKIKPAGLIGSFIVGMVFAAGWTPCVGPILGSILILAGTSQTIFQGIYLLASFSFGLGVSFLLISVFINFFIANSKKINRFFPVINAVTGGFLVIVGILLATNYFGYVSSLLNF